eukprot:scaffold6568_cov60-Phaeocystis_antarctica.AAC.2
MSISNVNVIDAACADATWTSLTETALEPPPPVLGVSSSTMRGGAVSPSSSCVRHAARGAGKARGRAQDTDEGSDGVRRGGGGCAQEADVGDVAPSPR